MIEKRLVYFNKYFKTQNDLLDFMSDDLYSLGYVTDEFKEKIKEREAQYPTGLKLQGMNVAICHADPEYVLENRIVGIHLDKPVTFRNIETHKDLEVDFVFGLIFNDGNKHITHLQKLAQILINEENIQELKQLSSAQDLYDFMAERID